MITIHTNDTSTQELCLAYCDAKSALWRMFFGWRGTYGDDMVFKMSAKAWRKISEKEWSE